MSQFVLKTNASIQEIGASRWQALAGNDNPFNSFAFLHALEQSGSVAAHTGWQPQHLSVETETGELIGAVPAYLKGHSQGEYVFDHAWQMLFSAQAANTIPNCKSLSLSRRRQRPNCSPKVTRRAAAKLY